MGYEYGDAQNIAVRVFLNQFSKKFNFFNENWKQKTIEYFDNKCPYTENILTKENRPVMDHVIPFNREFCGLHVYGNILVVTHKANQEKHNLTLEEFLRNEPEKLIKIQNFMKESGFVDIYSQYNTELKLVCNNLYEQIRITIEGNFNSFSSKTALNDTVYKEKTYIDTELHNFINTSATNKTINKNGRDNTKYRINFLEPQEKSLFNVSKGKVPTEVLRFLLKNNLLSDNEINNFRKNRFGRGFYPSYGDIELMKPPNEILNRFNTIQVNEKTFYICNQWGIDCLPAFNDYINKNYSEVIKII